MNVLLFLLKNSISFKPTSYKMILRKSCNLFNPPTTRVPLLALTRTLRGKINNPPVPEEPVLTETERTVRIKHFDQSERTMPYTQYTQKQKDWYWGSGGYEVRSTAGVDNHFGKVWPFGTEGPEKEVDFNRVNPEEEPFRQVYQENRGKEDDGSFSPEEVVSDKNAWFWVQRVLPSKKTMMFDFEKLASDDRSKKPSGWIAPPLTKPNKSYFVKRSRGGIFPVSKKLVDPEKLPSPRRLDEHVLQSPPTVLTMITRVDGNVRDLEIEVLEYLMHQYSMYPKSDSEKNPKKILSSVDELEGQVSFKGDHVQLVVKFLEENGF